VRVADDLPVFRYECGVVFPGGRHDDLVGGIAVKRLGQSTTLDQDGPRYVGELQAGALRR
jgi:hypothetical protein